MRNEKLGIRKLFFVFYIFTGVAVFAQNTGVSYAIIHENPVPGEPVAVGIAANNTSGIRQAVLYGSGGRRLAAAAFFSLGVQAENRPVVAAVLTVPSTAQPGFAVINIEGALGLITEIPIVIREKQFRSDEIALNEALTGLRVEYDPQKTAEAELLWAIINSTGTEIYCDGNFIPPVSSTRRTGLFGDRRVYRYSNGKSDTSIHAGVDYGVPKGTPVLACASGKVILARFRIVTGNSVIIEHLPGVYSLYYHLDSIEIGENTMVEPGTQLGLSGATGLATGPHLHWEIRVSGENTDPDILIERPLLDKDAILAKMMN